MINSSPIELVFTALYPEIHYRFRYFPFSLYFRRQPEIITDVPRRIENSVIPVTLLIKDSHLFPVKFLSDIKITLNNQKSEIHKSFAFDDDWINELWRHKVLIIKGIPEGEWQLTIAAEYQCGKKIFRLLNHNLPGLKKAPLKIYMTDKSLPRPEGYLIGDMHCHSLFTSDQVEFGAPLESLAVSAKSAGLDFAAVTDHTYDMDDHPDNFLKNDPVRRKWKSFLKKVNEINNSKDDSAYLLPGQEVTVRNSKNRNVHLLLLGSDNLFPGTGDSAEKWFRTNSEYSISQLADTVSNDCMLAAAHPWAETPLLEWLLVRRGRWSEADFIPSIKAAQIVNGGSLDEVWIGVERWRRLLASGRRIALWAGNDSHGNFNRFRQVGMPMLRLRESGYHLMGIHRTGIFSPPGISGLSDGIRSGMTYISNGPGIGLTINELPPGSSVPAGECKITLDTASSPEFGKIIDYRLINNNDIHDLKSFIKKESRFQIKLNRDLKPGYAFAQCRTDKGAYCVTSAVFLL
ncbi:CehA/McbA family metallohydrolase [bacterium]|nr:CehA/McbA family metallohydrolase [bacterium]